jgi:hypothetical protein
MARLYLRQALTMLGLPSDFRVQKQADFEVALALCKEKIVAARKANNDQLAAEFSCCKELFRSRHNRMVSRQCECGRAKDLYATQCSECSRTRRYYSKNLMAETPLKLHEIEVTPVAVPHRWQPRGLLTLTLKKLAESGQTGDSFITDRTPSAIKLQGKMFGLQCVIRIANPNEKDLKKRVYRVWRSDGLSEDELNALIQKRLKGEPVPATPPCHQPTPEELASLKQQKHPKKSKSGGK